MDSYTLIAIITIFATIIGTSLCNCFINCYNCYLQHIFLLIFFNIFFNPYIGGFFDDSLSPCAWIYCLFFIIGICDCNNYSNYSNYGFISKCLELFISVIFTTGFWSQWFQLYRQNGGPGPMSHEPPFRRRSMSVPWSL